MRADRASVQLLGNRSPLYLFHFKMLRLPVSEWEPHNIGFADILRIHEVMTGICRDVACLILGR